MKKITLGILGVIACTTIITGVNVGASERTSAGFNSLVRRSTSSASRDAYLNSPGGIERRVSSEIKL